MALANQGPGSEGASAGATPICRDPHHGQRRRMIDSLPRRALSQWVLAVLLACAIGGARAAQNPKGPEGYQTTAPTAILIDADGGSVLFEKNADDLVAPASLSKLMTAEVVFNEIKQGRLKPTDEFIVSEKAWRRGGAPSRTSR